MVAHIIRFRCPGCQAQVKGPSHLCGQRKKCPGCGRVLRVPRVPSATTEPMLVLQEEEHRFRLVVR